MTRRDRDVVELSIGNWIALLSLAATLIGAGWAFTLNISGRLNAVEAKVQAIERQIVK